MKYLQSYGSFLLESKQQKLQPLIDQLLGLLEQAVNAEDFYTDSFFTFHYVEIASGEPFDGNIIGNANFLDEDNEDSAAIFITSADNHEEIPHSIDDKTCLSVGNYGNQRLIHVEFNTFTEAVQFIKKGLIEKMLDWFNADERNDDKTYNVYSLPDFLKV